MAAIVGLDCTLAVGTGGGKKSYPAIISGTSPQFNQALQPVILATGDPNNSLAGYTPGQATAGFQIATSAFPDTAVGLITALLAFTGTDVNLQFGSIGGVSATGCLTTLIEVTASTGGRAMEIRATYETNAVPVATGTASATTLVERPFYWIDAAAAVLLGKTHQDVAGFTLRIRRTIARGYFRNAAGLPTYLRVVRQEAEGTVDVALDDVLEITQALQTCPSMGDISFGVAQTCFASPAVGGSVTFTVKKTRYDGLPRFTGDTEQFVVQSIPFRADRGLVLVA